MSDLFDKLRKYLEGFSVQRNAEAALWTAAFTFIGCMSSGLEWRACIGATLGAVFGGSFVEGRAFKMNQKAIIKEQKENDS